MANETREFDDIDFDEDIEIDDNIFTSGEQEGNSVEIGEQDLSGYDSDQDEDVTISDIPLLVFVDERAETESGTMKLLIAEENIRQTKRPIKPKASPEHFCSKCGKKYQRPSFLKVHQENCEALTKENGSEINESISDEEKEYHSQGVTFLKKALEDASKDALFTGSREPGASVGLLVKAVTSNVNNENMQGSIIQFSNFLTKHIFPLVNLKKCDEATKEGMYTNYLNLVIGEKLKDKWSILLQELQIRDHNESTCNNLLQYFVDRFLCHSLTFFKKKQPSPITKWAITPSEEQSLRYVAGYIVFCIRNNVKNKQSEEGSAVLDLTSTWGNTDDSELDLNVSLLDYTKLWVDKVNRGGLFCVNDQFYQFIKQIESVARMILNINLMVTYCDQDLRKILIEKFNQNKNTQEIWQELSKRMANRELAGRIQQQIFRKWVNIRAHAFVRVWLQILKSKLANKGKGIEKSEPSLRKTLGKRKAQKVIKTTPIKPQETKKTEQNTTPTSLKQQAAKKKLLKAKALIRKKK